MKTTLITLAAIVGFAAAAAADPLEGNWRTSADDNGESGVINVAPCGAALCGTLVQAFDSSGASIQTPSIGRQIIFDTTPSGGDGAYRGQVWSPDRDKTYNSRLQLNGNQLAVSGCVLFICRDGGTWTRN